MWVFRKEQTVNHITKDIRVYYEVGFFDSDGDFNEIYTFDEKVTAAQQVHFLNGGN